MRGLLHVGGLHEHVLAETHQLVDRVADRHQLTQLGIRRRDQELEAKAFEKARSGQRILAVHAVKSFVDDHERRTGVRFAGTDAVSRGEGGAGNHVERRAVLTV